MLNNILANFYERDLRKLVKEINLFRDEANLWKTHGSIKNSSGNLALHIIGGSNFFIGDKLAQTGYIRDRDREFSQKNVPREVIVGEFEQLIPLVKNTLNNLTADQLENPFPVVFDGATNSVSYVLVTLLAHLNYHLGQVNYLRRMLDDNADS